LLLHLLIRLKMFGGSQGFSFGETSTQQASPVKRVRQEEKQTCVPVTVRVLESAFAARADESSEVLIHGSEVGVVHLVGVVEGLVQQTAMLEFQLNDASGRIKVRHYGAGLGEALKDIAAGQYVSVIGNLRTSPAVHVSAMTLRAVSSPDEVSYHMIEVALATLRLRSTAAGSPDPLTPVKRAEAGTTISPVKADAPMQIIAPEPTVQKSADLRSSIITALQQETASAEGVALPSILAKLAHCQTSTQKVKEILSDLVNDGEVFTTIDDEHFSAI